MYGNYNNYGVTPYQTPYQTQNRLDTQYNNIYQSPYQNQSIQQNVMAQQMLKGRPVSSYDEAKASMIDLDGSLFVFTDVANKRIYTKQILMDGSAEIKTYVLKKQTEQVEEEQTDKFVPYSVYEKDKKNLNTQMNKIKKLMEELAHEADGKYDDAKNDSK